MKKISYNISIVIEETKGGGQMMTTKVSAKEKGDKWRQIHDIPELIKKSIARDYLMKLTF